MNLDELCKKLIEYEIIDIEKFNPGFTTRIMREGGGVAVLQNQDADIVANIRVNQDKIAGCIDKYSPEKVETYFYLQELANHAREVFYKNSNSSANRTDRGDAGNKRLIEQNRKTLIERISQLEPNLYKSIDIGKPIGLTGRSVGVFLAALDDNEKEQHRIRYLPDKQRWEKY
mgnify:CR=1 FL=1